MFSRSLAYLTFVPPCATLTPSVGVCDTNAVTPNIFRLLYSCKGSLMTCSVAVSLSLYYNCNASSFTQSHKGVASIVLSGESLDVSDCLSKNEGVDILGRSFCQARRRGCTQRAHVCSLIGIRNLEIANMPANMILIRSGISTENIQQDPRMLQRLSAIIPLHETDHLWGGQSLILQPSHLQTRL